ncbi:MAG: helix-turn-helix transcriptional regulator [Rhizomicrobium sp.]
MAIERKLSNRLKNVRTGKGLTQTELAARLGVSRKTVNTVENGIFIPSTLLALAMAETLGVTVEDIFRLEPDNSAPPA